MCGLILHCFYFEGFFFFFQFMHKRTQTQSAFCWPSEMSAHARKRNIDAECIVSSKTWTTKYLFAEVSGKAVCSVCFFLCSTSPDVLWHPQEEAHIIYCTFSGISH